MNYYNEYDRNAAAWLRALIADGLIPDGVVDERSIVDVRPSDLAGFTQCHFFAGIGGWPLALQLAGWPADRPVWTGSCPCPPFSTAGKKKRCPHCSGKPIPHPRKTGVFACVERAHEWYADARHLWPEFLRLIADCRPPVVLGEQVASQDGEIWLAGVRATLEECGYAVGAGDLPAACVGAPHIRQRLFWVADAECVRREVEVQQSTDFVKAYGSGETDGPRSGVALGRLADAQRAESRCGTEQGSPPELRRDRPAIDGRAGGLGHSVEPGLEGLAGHGDNGDEPGREYENPRGHASTAGCAFWRDSIYIPCGDGKARRVGLRPAALADGIPAGVDRGGAAGVGQVAGWPTPQASDPVEGSRTAADSRQACLGRVVNQQPDASPLDLCIPILTTHEDGRAMLLKGYGNAIIPAVAAVFIRAYLASVPPP